LVRETSVVVLIADILAQITLVMPETPDRAPLTSLAQPCVEQADLFREVVGLNHATSSPLVR